MENYNPRQNTRMRWKDAKELEKFNFITGDFGLVDEVIEEASKHKPWCKIVNVFKDNGPYKPILIFDTANVLMYIGSQENDTIYLNRVYQNTSASCEIVYDLSTDKLTITCGNDEVFISEDNVKTIFGQSISGTGDIGLYMHVLGLIKSKTEYGDTEYKILVTYYSSNNLEVDSLQDLTTLTKASSTNKVILTGIAFYNAESGNPANTIYNDYCGVQFDGTNWRFRQITDTNTPTGALITAVSDIVTPI